MQILSVASTISDNFMYVVASGDDCVLIDPVDAVVAVAAAKSTGAQNFRVFTTHGHPDHAAGNASVKELLGCEVIGPSNEIGDWEYDREVSNEDSIPFDGGSAKVIALPGHTPGHIAFLFGSEHIFVGDTLFVGGVGNCRFGGDPRVLFQTFTNIVPIAHDQITFHSGHDYAMRNWEFILSVEPDNARAAELMHEYAEHVREDGPITHTVGCEREYNPFLRVHDATLQANLFERYPDLETNVADPAERAFRLLRSLRDEF